jgi:hypothetical protein
MYDYECDEKFFRHNGRFENLCWDAFVESMKSCELTPELMKIYNAIYLLGRQDEKDWKREIRYEKGYC